MDELQKAVLYFKRKDLIQVFYITLAVIAICGLMYLSGSNERVLLVPPVSIIFLTLTGLEYLIIRYRIRKGYYGNNSFECLEALDHWKKHRGASDQLPRKSMWRDGSKHPQ